MLVLGSISLVAGAVLFLVALIRTVRRNRTARIPFYRNAPVVPRGSVLTRAVGAGLMVFGSSIIAGDHGLWGVAILAGVVLATSLVLTLHNRRVLAS